MLFNSFEMANKTKVDLLMGFYETEEGLHKIHTIKNGLINNTIESFPQIFATFAKTNLQVLLGVSFYAYGKKVDDPGKFTLNEIEFMSGLFKVDFDIMYRFVRKAMVDEQKRSKRKKSK